MSKKRFKTLKFKYLNRIWISFLVVLILLIMSLGTIAIGISSSIMEDEIISYNSDYQRQIKHNLEYVLSDIENTLVTISVQDEIKTFVNSSKDFIENNVLFYDIVLMFNDNMTTNRFISSIYLYTKENDLVITNNYMSVEKNRFFDTSWENFIDKDSLNISKPLIIPTHEINTFSGKKTNVITFIKPIPYVINRPNDFAGYLIFNIDEEELNLTINRNKIIDEQNIFILNTYGQIISSQNKSDLYKKYDWVSKIIEENKITDNYINKIDSIKYHISYNTINEYDWKLVSIIKYKDLIKNQRQVNIMFISICLFLLAIIIPLSKNLSKRLYKPILSFIEQLSYEGDENIKAIVESDIKYINYSIKHIIEDKENLEENLLSVRPIAKEIFIKNLVTGVYTKSEKVSNNLKILKIDFPYDWYLAISISVDKIENTMATENEVSRRMLISDIKNSVRDYFANIDNCNISVEEIQSNVLCLIINSPEAYFLNSKSFNLLIIKLKEYLEINLKISLTFGVGLQVYDLLLIKESYKESYLALSYKLVLGTNNIIYWNDIDSREKNDEFSSSITSKIENNLKNSKILECIPLIEELFDEFIESNISVSCFEKKINELLNIYLHSIFILNLDQNKIVGYVSDLYLEIALLEDIDEIKTFFKDLLIKTEEYLKIQYEHKNIDVVVKIKDFINENYGENITINILASKLFMNPAYLGRLFKKSENKSINEYLNEVRMEKAKELLLNTTEKINDISDLIGLTSPNYFIHCFKKYYGITPKKFREKDI